MTYYLVMHKGEWYLARPGAMWFGRVRCESCDNTGRADPGDRVGSPTCKECNGEGHIDFDQIHLCWIDKSTDGLVCLEGEADRIAKLPD